MSHAEHWPIAAGSGWEWRGSGVYNFVGSEFGNISGTEWKEEGRKGCTSAELVSWSMGDGGPEVIYVRSEQRWQCRL
jgi:hypothetical protein